MSIAYDNYGAQISGTSTSWTHITGSGANGIIVVGVGMDNGATTTGVTYAGVALTPQFTLTVSSCSLWYGWLVAPVTGSNSVTVTVSGSPVTIMGSSITFTGVHQTQPMDSVGATNTNSSGSATSVNITTAHEYAWITDFVVYPASTLFNPIPNAGQIRTIGENEKPAWGASYQLAISVSQTVVSDGWPTIPGPSAGMLAAISLNPALGVVGGPFGAYQLT